MKNTSKKCKFAIIISILVFSNLFNISSKNLNKSNTNDLKFYNLRGKVKKSSEKTYKVRDSFGLFVKEYLIFDNYKYLFDSCGNILIVTNNFDILNNKYEKNKLSEFYKRLYNGEISHIKLKYDANGNILERNIYKYDENMNSDVLENKMFIYMMIN